MKEILLTKGKVALVDAEDYDRIEAHKWFATSRDAGAKWYAARSIRSNGKKHQVYMHREVLDVSGKSAPTDHKNGNGLDNRRSNLRLATPSQNIANAKPGKANRTGFRGVYSVARCHRWSALIKVNGQRKYLGIFKTPEEASEAYRQAAEEVFGEYAYHRRSMNNTDGRAVGQAEKVAQVALLP